MLASPVTRIRALQLLLAAAAVSLTGVYLLKISTPYGLGLVNDSAAYVGGAEAILAGRGFTRTTAYGVDVPILHFPPGFSLLLAGVYAVGVEPLVGARLVVLLLFALGSVAFGLLIRLVTDSWMAGLLGAILFTISETSLRVYSLALSEPLFLLAMIVSFVALGMYFRQQRRSWLALAGLAAAAATLTRYTGMVLLISGGLALGLQARRPRTLARDVATYLIAGFLPVALWLARNWSQGGSFTNRVPVWHPIPLEALDAGIGGLIGWILPLRFLTDHPGGPRLQLLSWALVAGVIAWTLWAFRQRSRLDPPAALAGSLALFCAAYPTALVVSISLFDASTPLDIRLLAPMVTCLLALAIYWLDRLWAGPGRLRRIAAIAVAVSLVGLSVGDAVATVRELEIGGQGFASLSWRNSRSLAALDELPPEMLIYTNRQSAVLLLLGRPSLVAPTPTDPATKRPRTDYPADLAQMRDRLEAGRAVLAIFHLGELDLPEDRQWMQDLTSGIPILAEFNDAVLYGRVR